MNGHTLLLIGVGILGLFLVLRGLRRPGPKGAVLFVTGAPPRRRGAGLFVWVVAAIGAFIVWKLFQTP